MPTVKTDDGINLHYATFGEGKRDLFIHPGWSFSSSQWEDFVPKHLDLSALRVIVHDPRGYGKSDKPNEGYTVERYAKDAMAVAQHAKAARPVLLGHSMGGKVTQYMAATYPDAFSGQFLALSLPAFKLPFPPELVALYKSAPGNRSNIWSVITLAMMELPIVPMREKMIADSMQACAPALIKTLDTIVLGTDFSEILKNTRVPTLVLADDDPIVTRDFIAQAIVPAIPGARMVYLPGPGHYPHIERPREFAAILQAFCAGIS